MIEVFKTNVNKTDEADRLADQIQLNFANYIVNFDLEDCDKILRVKSKSGSIQASTLISFLKDLGFSAEVLPDEFPLS